MELNSINKTGTWSEAAYRVLYINARQREHGVPLARQEVAEVLT